MLVLAGQNTEGAQMSEQGLDGYVVIHISKY